MQNAVRLAVNLLHLGGEWRRCALLLAGVVLCAGTVWPAQAQVTETVLYNFTGGSDGAVPQSSVLGDFAQPSGAPRAFYGTTDEGGGSGDGTIFKLTPPSDGGTVWTETTLWSFSGGSGGGGPLDGLFARTKRIFNYTSLYGTTTGNPGGGVGTVFSLTGKTLTTLWNFSFGTDGAIPEGNVIADESGALYTTAASGGQGHCGTVIRLTPPRKGQTVWPETTLWGFSYHEGCLPSSGVIADQSGALYGTTAFGGRTGNGAVFKLTPPGEGQTTWTEQTLYSLEGGDDGSTPFAPLTMGAGGVLYGATEQGGGTTSCFGFSCGVVFELTPPKPGETHWKEQVIWRFSGSDGMNPDSGLILDRRGVLYGTTLNGGTPENGFVFKLTPPREGQTAWTETTLWTFDGADGSGPDAALIADKNGVLYGTTLFGGTSGGGVVFSLTGTGFAP